MLYVHVVRGSTYKAEYNSAIKEIYMYINFLRFYIIEF